MDLRPLIKLALFLVAVTYGLLLSLASFAGLLGIPIAALVLLSLWRYSYAVLRHVAQGRVDIPPPGIETMNPVGEFALLTHFIFWMGGIWYLLSGGFGIEVLGGALRWTLAIVLPAVFPASAALMGLTNNLAYALSPMKIVGVVRTLAYRYVWLLLVCFSLMLLSEAVQRLIVSQLAWLALFTSMIAVWTQLALFALIGLAIHEHREEFDIPDEAESKDERAQRYEREDRTRNWQITLDQAYGMISSREIGAGYDTLLKLIEDEGHRLDLYRWLFDSTWNWEDRTHALNIGRTYIGRLLKSGDTQAALEVYRKCRQVSSTIEIAPADASVLADYAQSIGHHVVADELRYGIPKSE